MGVHGLSALIFLILTEQTLLRGKIFSELGLEKNKTYDLSGGDEWISQVNNVN